MGEALESGDYRTAESRPRLPISIGRLLAYASILFFTAIATGVLMFLAGRSEERRVLRASELAEDRLDRLAAGRETLLAGTVENPVEDVVVAADGGERYARFVSVDTSVAGNGRARVTVTVQWETFTGTSHVRMCRFLEVREAPGP
jgi:hypothetical protein